MKRRFASRAPHVRGLKNAMTAFFKRLLEAAQLPAHHLRAMNVRKLIGNTKRSRA
jgi:hypothetical protein